MEIVREQAGASSRREKGLENLNFASSSTNGWNINFETKNQNKNVDENKGGNDGPKE